MSARVDARRRDVNAASGITLVRNHLNLGRRDCLRSAALSSMQEPRIYRYMIFRYRKNLIAPLRHSCSCIVNLVFCCRVLSVVTAPRALKGSCRQLYFKLMTPAMYLDTPDFWRSQGISSLPPRVFYGVLTFIGVS